jgi:hypothetical protein
MSKCKDNPYAPTNKQIAIDLLKIFRDAASQMDFLEKVEDLLDKTYKSKRKVYRT